MDHKRGKLVALIKPDMGAFCRVYGKGPLANELELSGLVIPLCFQWTNEVTHYEDTSKTVSVEVAAATNKRHFYALNGVRTVKNLNLPGQKIEDIESLVRSYLYLDIRVLKDIRDTKPKLLIGQDNCGLIIPRKIIQPRNDNPIMSWSRLGWTIHGAFNGSRGENEKHVNLCCSNISNENLHLIIKDSFKLENFGMKIQKQVTNSIEDNKAITIMENTIKNVGNRYEIGHLYREGAGTFPESKENALKRLFCMERKMDRDKEFAKQYCEKIEEYVKKGYATKLENNEIIENPKDWYLPHFAVWNVNKPGKIRLVFDAAATSHGYSLNDFLLQGPDYVPSLIAVLWRFRQGRIAFGADIKEMFHQVVIREKDRSSQRFFWREGNKNKKPDIYEMDVLIFGAVSSPSVAQFVKNKNAEMYENKFPGITRAIKSQHYVDDYLDSCNNEDEAIERVKNVIHVHKKGGFEITKWISNSQSVIKAIPENLRAEETPLNIDSQRLDRILGLTWSSTTDKFVFHLNLKKIPEELLNASKIPSKREVLRIVMSIFDPIGFLAPLIIRSRLLLQDIWRSKVGWDSEIPENLFTNWKKWLETLHQIMPLNLNRYYFPSVPEIKDVSLHVFSDASDKAYAAVAFLRVEFNEEVHVSFVYSKCKVAPMTQQTIPKLELQGAMLATRMAKIIHTELEYKIVETYYWTDSLIILHQIRNESRRFPMFVACRLSEIHECTSISQWRWVPSDQNVADFATKELKNIDLTQDRVWFSGPQFLKMSKNLWPQEPIHEISEITCFASEVEINENG